ncbi:MAG: hypothetical protein CMJ82_06820, partial [Planctomycetaceae bacterium]|nr:hypothetical protein [Planctomycetaceae bacterium]
EQAAVNRLVIGSSPIGGALLDDGCWSKIQQPFFVPSPQLIDLPLDVFFLEKQCFGNDFNL